VSHWWLALGSVALVSAVPLAGIVALAQGERRLEGLLRRLVSFAVGAMLGGAFLHLLPEALERSGSARAPWLLVLVGFVAFFVIEKFFWLHEHRLGPRARRRSPLATLSILGDGVHNFVDGMAIAAAYLADPRLGVTTTVAVLLHEVPQELGDFAVLVYAGVPARRAVWLNLGAGATALLGAAAVLILGTRVAGLTDALLAIAAGSFVYIAAADLVPALHEERSPRAACWQIALVLTGIGIMVAARG
jgi:zinc and cadmium transporter